MEEILNQLRVVQIKQQANPIALATDLISPRKLFYIESYGCQMNFSDSEIVASILAGEGFGATKEVEEADLILLNTCSIREKAEQTIRKRLTEFKKLKRRRPSTLIAILGCMAERLKTKLLEEEKLVDLVVGPDAYRTLPELIGVAEGGQKGVNVLPTGCWHYNARSLPTAIFVPPISTAAIK